MCWTLAGAPVTIVSAGIEDIIFEVLRLEGIEAVSAWDEGADTPETLIERARTQRTKLGTRQSAFRRTRQRDSAHTTTLGLQGDEMRERESRVAKRARILVLLLFFFLNCCPSLQGGDPDLPRVYANRMRYDAEGIVVGCEPSPPATSENKHVAYHDMRPRFEGVERVLIVGDSCGDVQTAKAIPAQYLAVGFYDPANPWKGRDAITKSRVLSSKSSSSSSSSSLAIHTHKVTATPPPKKTMANSSSRPKSPSRGFVSTRTQRHTHTRSSAFRRTSRRPTTSSSTLARPWPPSSNFSSPWASHLRMPC